MDAQAMNQQIKNEILLALHWFCTCSLKWYEEVKRGKDSLLQFLNGKGAVGWDTYFADDEGMEEALIEMSYRYAQYDEVRAVTSERLCQHPPCWRTSKSELIKATVLKINEQIRKHREAQQGS